MKRSLKWKFHFTPFSVGKRIWRNVALAQAGNITTVLNSYVPLFVLSGFAPGIVTALTFAQQLSVLPNSLVTNHFTSVAAIKFNELYSAKAFYELNKIFVTTAEFLLFVLMPISGVMFFFSEEIVTLIFKHGRFEHSGVANASLFLKYLGLQLPLLAINNLFARLLMAGHKVGQSFLYQIVFNLVLLAMLLAGIQIFGIVGYPLALVVIYFLNIFACYFLEKYFFNVVEYSTVLKKFFVIFFLNAIMISLTSFLVGVIDIDNYILRLILAGSIYLPVLHILNSVFHVNENALILVRRLMIGKR
jgi:putative peptidoglycan lipid II flippase